MILRIHHLLIILLIVVSCRSKTIESPSNSQLDKSTEKMLDQFHGFWLGQCIANWTGLITEMDKIGGDGKDDKGAGFYTREDWNNPDQPNIWGSNNYADTIGFYLIGPDDVWGADDDTDIEYIYQYTINKLDKPLLSPEDIQAAWIEHIMKEEENYLWVSNQKAFDLMVDGLFPPQTSDPELNPFYEMIDAQLTTEIFGLYAPGNPELALKLAHLPIRVSARAAAAEIAEFYVIMYALLAETGSIDNLKNEIINTADQARNHLTDGSYPALMYDFVKKSYLSGLPWESTRDSLHQKYQVNQEGDYHWYYIDEVCNGCFAAGINFGASLVSLFYGEGDFKNTVKIGALCGWDSDNPTATWGGILGYVYGKEGLEKEFNQEFSNRFNIHRTRIGFPNNGIDSFENMARVSNRIVGLVDSLFNI